MIQIIGAGAIGCLWLAKLLQAKQTCHIVSRSTFTSSILNFTHLTGKVQQFSISHSNRLLNLKENEHNSLILVCVKAPQVLNALLMQQEYISQQQIIILMHNGYGCAEEVRQHFPNNPIICATTANASLFKTEESKADKSLHVIETGHGPSYFGTFDTIPFSIGSDDLSQVINPFKSAMEDVYWSENIIEKCWLKLAINAAINPLTAIKQIKNGQLQEEQYAVLINKILAEVTCIATAEKIPFTQPFLQKTVSDVIQATSENFSSMNRDVFYKRPTEIDYINGYLIKKAQQHGIVTPLLESLYQEIKVMENH